jgi:vacuolar-type H+-ATPase subunit I/STV1
MALAFDFREAEQKVKGEQAEIKVQLKEEEHARDEAEKAREEAIEEQERYQTALDAARKEMESKSESERAGYEAKIKLLQEKLTDATTERERATAMAQITKKGHVYIISNIGSFGENVFKIGLTRRKDPVERVKELSDASVPFGFDVHAVIYAEDAPGLEHTFHLHFDNKRMNKANPNQEFFRAKLEDISKACEKLGNKPKITLLAEAREYRETLAIENESKAAQPKCGT